MCTDTSLYLTVPSTVTALLPVPAVPIGESGSGRERPPVFASRIGTAGQADVHWRALAWEGRSRPIDPCGKATRRTVCAWPHANRPTGDVR